MPRKARDPKLDTRTARLQLEVRRSAYTRLLEAGLFLLYYRNRNRGSWAVRVYDATKGRRITSKLGLADDYQEADGLTILDFSQAQAAARVARSRLLTGWRPLAKHAINGITVEQAVSNYINWLGTHRKSQRSIRTALMRHVPPELAKRTVESLTTEELQAWHVGIAQEPARCRAKKGEVGKARSVQDPRARRSTANRLLAYLKAALNRAWKDGQVQAREAWMRVQPFEKVTAARVVYLTAEEARRLVNAAAPEFRPVVQAALYTGARYGEICRMRVEDFDPDVATVFVSESKSGKPRHIPLTAEGLAFFKRQAAGKVRGELLFTKPGGRPWGNSHQTKPMSEALAAAKLPAAITFHALRHTYASHLVSRGVSMKIVAELLGHSSSEVTERFYAHLAPNAKRDAVRAHLPDLGAADDTPYNVTHIVARR